MTAAGWPAMARDVSYGSFVTGPPALGMAGLALTLTLFACSSTDVVQNARFDPEERTMTAPPGSDYLLGGLKEELRSHGFTVVVAPGWARNPGPTSDAPPIYESRTRYRLYLDQRWRDFCLTGGHRMKFDLSVFDHELGREMLRISGIDCTPDVIDKFREALEVR